MGASILERYSKFFDKIKSFANKLNNWITSKRILYLISNYEADGIAATSILIRLIYALRGRFHLRFVDFIDYYWINNFVNEFSSKLDKGFFVFIDNGAFVLHYLQKNFPADRVLVLDHKPKNPKNGHHNILYIDLEDMGINGAFEISSSVLTYLIAKQISNNNDELESSDFIKEIAPFAVIGALGAKQDVGAKHSLIEINKLVLDECINMGLIEEVRDLRLFRKDQPISISLTETFDPFLIGLTNNKRNVNEFLLKLDIPPSISVNDLDIQKKSELNSELIKHLINPKDSTGTNYILTKEIEKSYLKDARLFSIILNVCGIMGSPNIGLEICLGDRGAQLKKASEILEDYRNLLTEGLDHVSTPDNILETSLIQCVMINDMLDEKMVIPVLTTALNCHILNPEKIPIGAVELENDMIALYAFVYYRENNIKDYNIWEALRLTNKKLKIDTKTIGNKMKSRVLIPKETDLSLYLDTLDEMFKKQISES